MGLAIIAAIGFALASCAAETPRTAETPSTPRGEDTERLEGARSFIDALPSDLAELVARENALRLYRLSARIP